MDKNVDVISVDDDQKTAVEIKDSASQNSVNRPKKTKVVLRKVERRKSKRVTGIKLILLSILLIPLFAYLYIISLNSDRLINNVLSIVMLVLTIVSVVILILGILMATMNKKVKTGRKVKTWFKVIMGIFLTGYVTVSTAVMVLLYGPSNGFRDWLVTTAMMTMEHQYLAEWFYNDATIHEVLSRNTLIETGEDTNPDLVDIGGGISQGTVYANQYEEQILKHDEGNDVYKIIDIKEKNFKGKMAVVYDPSKVRIGVSKGIGMYSGAYGQMITEIAKANKASIAINAGGFYDPDWNSYGGVPHGLVVSNGKVIAETGHGRAVGVGGLIGFNKENKLVLIQGRVTGSQAIKQGIRDAIDFGPFLIVNGKSSYVNGNGGWGKSPRSAIAQRKDGIVLLLIIDGRQTASAGADMNDLVSVLLKYGAYNAANLDGGTSSAMSLNGKIITNPRNGVFQAKTRAVPNAWIVLK